VKPANSISNQLKKVTHGSKENNRGKIINKKESGKNEPGTVSLIKELKQVIYELPFRADLKASSAYRKKVAHFCEHNGICIEFTQARKTWHALAPLAVRPWWLTLSTIRAVKKSKHNTNNKKNIKTGVLENA
jgi:hypothetical protein